MGINIIMRIYIIMIIITYSVNIVIMPFFFGEEKSMIEYNAGEWLKNILLNAPLVYFLINYLIQQNYGQTKTISKIKKASH